MFYPLPISPFRFLATLPVRDLDWRVGGAGDGGALPGEEEDDAAVGGGRVEEAHVGGGVVVREDDVDARRGAHDVWYFLSRLVELCFFQILK